MIPVSRRSALAIGATVVVGAAALRYASSWRSGSPRLLVVMLRGALDGLSMVVPTGDPDYGTARGRFALVPDRDGGFGLEGPFTLHPRLPTLARLYRQKQALFVHAVATPYRERSHFDGQAVLESGLAGVDRTSTGWLNRLIGVLPARAGTAPSGLAIGTSVPQIMRGPAPVITWAPRGFNLNQGETALRLLDIYRHTRPALAETLEAGLQVSSVMTPAMVAETRRNAGGDQVRLATEAAARLLLDEEGSRVGVLDLTGFDTHIGQSVVDGRIGEALTSIDDAVASLETSLGETWSETVVMLLTEFGRTVRPNGSRGTDHGTGTAAVLVGGAVKGGQVIADWPGLGEQALLEGRDLRPTLDIRALLKGVLAAHFDMSNQMLDTILFPDSRTIRPMSGLLV